MKDLQSALNRLERLNAIVTEYNPVKYDSSDRSRELAAQLPEAYGAVESIYRRYAGDREVVVNDDGTKKVFRNFFEAGWLSGRTFHSHEGLQELKKVIGQVRADLDDQPAMDAPSDPIDAAWSLLHARVQVVARERFRAGHYADAVEATFKELATVVRGLVVQRGGAELDGTTLMQTAFSPKNPVIVLADLSTQSGKDMQRGYMEMFSGAMAAIRNPKVHGNVAITLERALHLLYFASTLWFTLDERP